jgi:hypothetical protein
VLIVVRDWFEPTETEAPAGHGTPTTGNPRVREAETRSAIVRCFVSIHLIAIFTRGTRAIRRIVSFFTITNWISFMVADLSHHWTGLKHLWIVLRHFFSFGRFILFTSLKNLIFAVSINKEENRLKELVALFLELWHDISSL